MNKAAHSVCKRTILRVSSRRNHWSFLFSLFAILLPKCALCVTAYTGAIAMCSGRNMMGIWEQYGAFFFLILSLVILVSIGINRRGRRTLLSMSLVFICLLIMGYSEFLSDWKAGYYLGSIGLFIGIWINGSLYYIVKKIEEHFHIIKSKLPIA